MSDDLNLNEIKERHGRDGWKDAVFIVLADAQLISS